MELLIKMALGQLRLRRAAPGVCSLQLQWRRRRLGRERPCQLSLNSGLLLAPTAMVDNVEIGPGIVQAAPVVGAEHGPRLQLRRFVSLPLQLARSHLPGRSCRFAALGGLPRPPHLKFPNLRLQSSLRPRFPKLHETRLAGPAQSLSGSLCLEATPLGLEFLQALLLEITVPAQGRRSTSRRPLLSFASCMFLQEACELRPLSLEMLAQLRGAALTLLAPLLA